jgi:hypothetical protein
MIVRPYRDTWLLLHQRDHAWLSGQLARATSLMPLDQIGSRHESLAAIAGHDDGWAAWDTNAPIDETLKRPRSFDEMERLNSLTIWQASIDANTKHGALAAYMVASHFLRLAGLAADEPAVGTWIRTMSESAGAWLAEWVTSGPHRSLEAAEAAVVWLRFFDSMSLNLCRGQLAKPFPMKTGLGQTIELRWNSDDSTTLMPWPFEKNALSLNITGYLWDGKQDASAHVTVDDCTPVPLTLELLPEQARGTVT